MPTRASDAAFFASRIAISTAKALASADGCARASHIGIAKGYSQRLAALIRSGVSAADRSGSREGHPQVEHDAGKDRPDRSFKSAPSGGRD